MKYFENDILVLFELYEPMIGKAVDAMFQMVDFVDVDFESDTYQEYEGIAEVIGVPTH